MKTVAEETINDTAKQIHENSSSTDDDIVNTSYSCFIGSGSFCQQNIAQGRKSFITLSKPMVFWWN